MGPSDDAKQKAASTYNAASDFYDHPVNSFWEAYGTRTVERLDLTEGARVLDVCCGSGASALPAAEAVGPKGSVLGVDLAENLLALAREKAKARGLANIEFRAGDMIDLGLAAASFDAVVCVFGIFFVPDMERAMRALWRLVSPGGRLAITTWGPRFFEPANAAFWSAVGAERPDLHKAFNPWDRIAEPAALRALFDSAGIEGAKIEAEMRKHVLAAPEDWWPMVMGTGYRGTVEQLDAPARARVREACVRFIRQNGMHAVEANVLYGVAANALKI